MRLCNVLKDSEFPLTFTSIAKYAPSHSLRMTLASGVAKRPQGSTNGLLILQGPFWQPQHH